ncbi:hypothetical protein [Gordonia sp. CPCC 205333]|uniref:hypothetical protein n=1 Tax=Gordonia sp. CPCC 205333 TaxID=3140790 RepID=UPI003AF378FB
MSMMELSKDLAAGYTSHEVRTRFTPIFRGVRAPSGMTVELKEQVDALLMMFPDAVLGGWTAARLLRVPYSTGHRPEIIVPRRRPRAGVVMRHEAIPDSDVIDLRGYRCTSPERTAADLARHLPFDPAIAAVDQCVRRSRDDRQVTTVDAIIRFLDNSRYFHRGAIVREVLGEVDGRAESHWETYVRLLLHRNGLTMFEPQVPVFGGRYRLDLGAREYGIAVEYDGAHHRDGRQHARDVERWNAIQQEANWEIILACRRSIDERHDVLLQQVRGALRRRGWTG